MGVTESDRDAYFKTSQRPMNKDAEDKMELLSAGVTGGVEQYLDEWRSGRYVCANCSRELYSSYDKWKGPCAWPSFRKSTTADAISTTQVFGYNGYTCRVYEVYCGNADCDLFLGHQFEDAVEKGDKHPDARWRH